MNVATTPILNTSATLKHHSDDIGAHIILLEDKLLSKIDIFNLRNNIAFLKENNEKEKPADSNNEKDEALLLKEKVKFLELENSFLKSNINIKQKMIDSILKHFFQLTESSILSSIRKY